MIVYDDASSIISLCPTVMGTYYFRLQCISIILHIFLVFFLIIYIVHVSFEALKSEIVLVNDATSHGKRKKMIGPIKFPAKRAFQ